MAWETRRNKSYYYHKRREGERVVSEYVGSDPALGHLYDVQVMKGLQERDLARLDLINAKHNRGKLGGEFEQFSEGINALVSAHLILNGYHRHKGEWRRKRSNRGPGAAGTGS